MRCEPCLDAYGHELLTGGSSYVDLPAPSYATCTIHLADSDSAANIVFACPRHAREIVPALIGELESVEVIHYEPVAAHA